MPHLFLLCSNLAGVAVVIIGLYVLLWGKAEDVLKIKEGTHPKPLQNEIDQDSLMGRTSYKIDVEKLLLFISSDTFC